MTRGGRPRLNQGHSRMHSIRVRSCKFVVSSAGFPPPVHAFRIPSFALFVRFMVSPSSLPALNFLRDRRHPG